MDITKCILCNVDFIHIYISHENKLIKHLTACSTCMKMMEEKAKLDKSIMDIEYKIILRRERNILTNKFI